MPMDTQRLILFVIFSFSLLMLWDAWQREQRPPPPTQSQAAQPTGVPTPTSPVPAKPVAPAPQAGICLSDGTLVMPVQGRTGREPSATFATIMVSRDHGKSWTLGKPGYSGGNESQAAQLGDGSIMLNIRNGEETRVKDWLLSIKEEDRISVFMDSGDEDPLMLERAEVMKSMLDEMGIENVLHTGHGGHEYAYWVGNFEMYLEWLAEDWQ